MRARTLHGVGIAVAALALSTLSAGVATGATVSGPTSASGVTASAAAAGASSGTVAAVAAPDATINARIRCGTAFGAAFDDGIISNEGSLESSGAADFTCPKKKKKRTFSTVKVQGFFGDVGSTTFNVTVLENCGGEPCDDAQPVCSTTGVGTPTGAAFPAVDMTKINLDSRCRAKKGSNWLEVQAATESAWYWRTQSDVGAKYPADWKEGGAFGTGCTTYENGRDMQSCIFGGEVGQADFMFELKK